MLLPAPFGPVTTRGAPRRHTNETPDKAGRAAADTRHTEHQEKVKLYREDYRQRLNNARQEYPRERLAALSPKIIAAMAKLHSPESYAANRTGTVKRMRDLIKPREMQKNVH